MLFDTSKISTDNITNALLQEKNICLSVVRLDTIHPVVSGNKLFKLHFFMQEAIDNRAEGILTFGGVYSNHLVATAFACQAAGIKSVGIVRGEKPAVVSTTLSDCMEYGMALTFVSRQVYDDAKNTSFANGLKNTYPGYLFVPEGGYSPKGAAGAALVTNFIEKGCTHICTAVGTATTLAGIAIGAQPQQKIIGVPVLKGMHDIEKRVIHLTGGNNYSFDLLHDFDFGGYAKKTPALLSFMNNLYLQHAIPTDFVYTGKMMYAVLNSIEKDFFAPGSKITCLHTGGLQGNKSLPEGTLNF